MPAITTYDATDKIIVTKITGLITIDGIKKGLEDILKLSLEHDCQLWINDFSEAVLDVPIYQILKYVESLSNLTEILGEKRFRIRRAIVKNEQSDSFLFFEDKSVNTGHNLRVFSDFQSARSWLCGEKS
jgi:hypothetical protein